MKLYARIRSRVAEFASRHRIISAVLMFLFSLSNTLEVYTMGRTRRALAEAGIDVESLLHQPCPPSAHLPWDHIGIRQGRDYLEREYARAQEHLAAMERMKNEQREMKNAE